MALHLVWAPHKAVFQKVLLPGLYPDLHQATVAVPATDPDQILCFSPVPAALPLALAVGILS